MASFGRKAAIVAAVGAAGLVPAIAMGQSPYYPPPATTTTTTTTTTPAPLPTPPASSTVAQQLLGRSVNRISGLSLPNVLDTFFPRRTISQNRLTANSRGTLPSFAVVCITSSCQVTLRFRLTTIGRRARSSAVRNLASKQYQLTNRQGKVVRLRLGASHRRLIRSARRATLRISISVKDASGKTSQEARNFGVRVRG